jgi:hypothetical protein
MSRAVICGKIIAFLFIANFDSELMIGYDLET